MHYVMRRLSHNGVDELAMLGTNPDWKSNTPPRSDLVLSPMSPWVRARSSVRPMLLQVIGR